MEVTQPPSAARPGRRAEQSERVAVVSAGEGGFDAALDKWEALGYPSPYTATEDDWRAILESEKNDCEAFDLPSGQIWDSDY